jgi:hypothetical protein
MIRDYLALGLGQLVQHGRHAYLAALGQLPLEDLRRTAAEETAYGELACAELVRRAELEAA